MPAIKNLTVIIALLALILSCGICSAVGNSRSVEFYPLNMKYHPCPEEGWKYLYVEFAIVNNTNRFLSYTLRDFECETNTGHKYSSLATLGSQTKKFVRGTFDTEIFEWVLGPRMMLLGGKSMGSSRLTTTHCVFRIPKAMTASKFYILNSNVFPQLGDGLQDVIELGKMEVTIDSTRTLLDGYGFLTGIESSQDVNDKYIMPAWYSNVDVNMSWKRSVNREKIIVSLTVKNSDQGSDSNFSTGLYLVGDNGIVYFFTSQKGYFDMDDATVWLTVCPLCTKSTEVIFDVPKEVGKFLLINFNPPEIGYQYSFNDYNYYLVE